MNNKNNKGFTLIELLAVIVILGVLMVVAIPAMTRYIENSKKDVFADTAKKYISAARYSLLSENLQCDIKGTTPLQTTTCSLTDLNGGSYMIVPVSIIEVENDTQKSPWGKSFTGENAWVIVENTGNATQPKYQYSFVGVDASNNGISSVTKENELKRGSVVKGTAIQDMNKINNATYVAKR